MKTKQLMKIHRMVEMNNKKGPHMKLKTDVKWRKQMDMKNSEVVKNSFEALNSIAARRTSANFAKKVMETLMKTLNERFKFLKYVAIKDTSDQFQVQVSSHIDELDTLSIFRAVETAIRIIHMDLQDKGGLYFMKEFKELAGETTVHTLADNGIDLSILSIEQKHAYLQKKEKEDLKEGVSVLGYTWSDVSNWKYDAHNNVCILYNNGDQVLDKLNLDAIIKEHIERITGLEDPQEDDEDFNLKTERYEKEYELLHLLKSKDIDVDAALAILKVSEEELEHMVKRLMNLGFLEYADVDIVKITEKGMKYISKPLQ